MRRCGVFRSRYKRDSSVVTVLTRDYTGVSAGSSSKFVSGSVNSANSAQSSAISAKSSSTGLIAGTVIIAFFTILAIFADVFTAITGNDPYTEYSEYLDANSVPTGVGGISSKHWFGVTPLRGLDVFAIVAHGARVSLGIGVASTLISLLIGVTIGMIAGYWGGWVDAILSRSMDVFFGFPFLIFSIAISAIIPQSFPRPLLLILIIGFFGWPGVARLVRGQTLTLKSRNFSVASQIMGASSWHILSKQILPNMLPMLLVNVTFSIPGRIGSEAALSFLGVGMNPPSPSWGRAISDAIQWTFVDPWYLLFPGMSLFLLTWGFNLLGDGLEQFVREFRSGV